MPYIAPFRSFFPTIVVSLCVLVADIFLKAAALDQTEGTITPILGSFLGFTLHKNFGIVANLPIPLLLVVPATVVILGICAWWFSHVWEHNTGLAASILLLIAGGLGNLVDRLLHGFTTDYLLFFGRSIVNLSDGLVLVGLIGILLLQTPSPKAHS